MFAKFLTFFTSIPVTIGMLMSFPSSSFAINNYNVIGGNLITWGDYRSGPSIGDVIPRAQRLENPDRNIIGKLSFCWTKGAFDKTTKKAECHDNYQIYRGENDNPRSAKSVGFILPPNDPTITDWKQEIFAPTKAKGKSDVAGGNIRRRSPWAFHPLSELPNISWRIPDIAPSSDFTIYTAVNLDLYFSKNPFGFLNGNWSVDQTLDELGIEIINGRIAGVEGIYFATSEFTFDPDSETGWVPIDGDSALLNSADFQAANENTELIVIAEHTSTVSIPEPYSMMGILAFGTLSIASTFKRKLKPSESAEKEVEKIS